MRSLIAAVDMSKILLFQWQLCSEACGALYNFLYRYAVTADSILNAEPQTVILTQILNDSPVFRSVS